MRKHNRLNKINYLNFMLTLILVLLFLFSFLMIRLQTPLIELNKNLKILTESNNTIISLQQSLVKTTLELKDQIELFNSKFVKKKKQHDYNTEMVSNYCFMGCNSNYGFWSLLVSDKAIKNQANMH